MFYEYLQKNMNIDERVIQLVKTTASELDVKFKNVDDIAALNQTKILHAMQSCRLSDTHFNNSTGYGYHDEGREVLERIFSHIFKTEAALVRPQLVSGTHAIASALFGNLRPHDELFSPVGKPYDTLESVIGIKPTNGSLAEYGIKYTQVDLFPDGGFDYDKIGTALMSKPKMVTIQRSKGYAWRPSLSIDQIRRLIHFIKMHSPQSIVFVDNCYGEFVEDKEPTEVGADLIAGSLIKNPGGGLAPGGGYIAGRADLVEAAANRLTAPGLGSHVGPSLGMIRTLMHGLFLAPQTVASGIKGAILAEAVFHRLGFNTLPSADDIRTDIVQAIELKTPENVLAFCAGIQKAAPVDAFVTPEAAPMPGYSDGVVMAGGTFIQGSSIELSADAPLRPPYHVYFQGGLTSAHAFTGIVFAVNEMVRKKLISIGS